MSDESAAKVQPVGKKAPKVEWDDSDMSTSYANVCNVASTREEFVLFFGTNQAWKGNEEEVKIQLSDRVILSPFAAKRLARLLNSVMSEYESRFGSLDAVESVKPDATN